jgi:murein DD-endopeptidase MepM/ murein hydrolase activator NlpD
VNDLAQLNALTAPELLLAGQRVKLPAPISTGIRLRRVRPGDTLFTLAAEYGVSPLVLVQANALECQSCLVSGQLLRVPQPNVGTNLPKPFESVAIFPFLPRQGDTIIVRVKMDEPVQQLVGELAGHKLDFVKKDDTYVALSGVAALQDAGVYSITIRALQSTGEASLISGRVQIGAGSFGFENLILIPKLLPLLDVDVNQQERNDLDEIFRQWTPEQYWDGPLQLPVQGSRIVSLFGTRRNFNRGLLLTYHSGTDVVAPVGTPVHASANGKIVAMTQMKVRGNIIIIDHGRGVFTAYCHLSKFNVAIGQMVQTGDVIGLSGNTGRSEGPHVHWELAVGGVTVNPLAWTDESIP